ncbi:hypothetical protein MPTK1_1g27870 [Marchantia polymorpha subsp. ruderalis]|uniref:Uncharacterized protein n=2 Tax=Marchantia polymorpha TaxID=3197 RepID=A0AAF6AV18_MARPO|nr:hypothetical protein MARPO_0002s0091 [Marchantia polymorpha]BBN00289.1 hypothetical protein Mp_1g27870 [Marchantia polymorpha subsp. ruderalis]|eukprot:PTQ49595.1 hypothetical protein MARPO_0002s0091 [Marchantia polymorpha]
MARRALPPSLCNGCVSPPANLCGWGDRRAPAARSEASAEIPRLLPARDSQTRPIDRAQPQPLSSSSSTPPHESCLRHRSWHRFARSLRRTLSAARARELSSATAMLSTMRFIFERTKTPLEVMRENRRLMERGMREIEREKQSLHTIETKLIQEIKKAAKVNQWDAVKIMTVDLIRTRQRIIRCYNLYQQLKSISLHTQTLKSAESMADVLQGFIKAVRQLNLHVNQPALQKIMQEFEVHQMRMDMSLEEMEEEDLYEEEEEEEEDVDESEQLVCQVLDELGVDFSILV